MRSLAGVRSRWAAIGAACAVALGAGGFGVVNAVVSSGEKSVFVPVSPIRVLDTRDSTEISNGTRRLVVEGAITVADGSSQLVVPSAASAVAVNITATSTRKNGGYGFVTVFPCVSDSDAVPNASSLNFENGVDIANALSVSTSANGSICLYVYGTADLIVDVAGYYVDHNHDDRYYTEAEVDAALADKADINDLVGKADLENLVRHPVNGGPFTLDSIGDVGYHTSVAIGIDGNPIVAYFDASNEDLKVAACSDSRCSSAEVRTLDSTGAVGWNTSIALGVDGNPVISYSDNANGDLKVAICGDPSCSNAVLQTLDATDHVGFYSSTTIGADGNPIISYQDSTHGNLKVAVCGDPICATATTRTLDSSSAFVGGHSSIVIGVDGNPVVSYMDDTNGDLKVVVCSSRTCATQNSPVSIDSVGTTGWNSSMIIGDSGFPVVSYLDTTTGELKVAACTNLACSSSSVITALDTLTSAFSFDTSIALGTNGAPIVAYVGSNVGEVKVFRCLNPTCTSAASSIIDDAGYIFVGHNVALAIGIDGNPIISYLDGANRDLKVMTPWWVGAGR